MSEAASTSAQSEGNSNLKTCIWCSSMREISSFCKGKGYCKACKSDYDRKYRIANAARKSEVNKAWRKKPGKMEKRRISNRRWMARNPEKQKAASARWKTENQEKYMAYQKENRKTQAAKDRIRRWKRTEAGRLSAINSVHKRRNGILQTEIPPTRAQMESLKIAANGVCFYCKESFPKLTFDHVIPISKGGAHAISNLVMACGPCNFSKQAKDPEKFASEIGLLLI